jgi:ubiquinone biosynthesis protein COQ4
MQSTTQEKRNIYADFPEISPLPPRSMEWGKAWRAAKILKDKPYTPGVAYELILALDGGDSERMFQDFIAEPGAPDLIYHRPDLIGILSDRNKLAAMDEGSLGRAYLALVQDDGYTADGLTQAQAQVPSFKDVAPDPLRRWLFLRGGALHDVYHVLLGYGRDVAGEAALNSFTAACYANRIVRFYTLVSAFMVPRDNFFRNVSYMYEAWTRGRRSKIPLSTPWEELLPLPLEEVRRRLQIPSAKEAHPRGIMCDASLRGPWVPVSQK